MAPYTLRDKLFDGCNYVVLALIGLICLYPFLNLFAIALNEGTDTLRGGLTIFPRKFTLANFGKILTDPQILNAYKITIGRTVIGTVAGVFITALAAYGMSERKLPGRMPMMTYLLIPMFFGGGLIPMFLTLRMLGLVNTFWVYVIPGLFVVWNFIVMKTFFQNVPEELKESMRIDGANELRIFFGLIIPISLPMFAAISLFVAVAHWNDWFAGAFFVFDHKLVPVQTHLQRMMTMNLSDFIGQNSQPVAVGGDLLNYNTVTALSLRIAAVLVATIPILVLYPFLQKYFVKGVLIGSLKG